MIIDELLGKIPRSTFMEQHFLRLPFSLPGTASQFCSLGSWETIDAILASPDPDVMVVREGRRWADADRTPSPDEARRLHAEGYTLLVRHAERHHPGIAELARSFAEEFAAPCDVHLYCTPGNQHGFGWHYDAEDVFILQTHGSKEYSLRKNTVNPWPLVETLPQDMRYERELMPVMKCILKPGDWLYIPNGYWHVAVAPEPSISLAVGLLTPAAIDALDFLRQRLLSSMLWRQRLPVTGAASTLSEEELAERYAAIFSDLADDLARTLRDPAFLRSWLERNSESVSESR